MEESHQYNVMLVLLEKGDAIKIHSVCKEPGKSILCPFGGETKCLLRDC